MALLTVNDVSLGYDGRAIAEHLSFTVEKGDYLCIVGENGSGKTTLMKTLLNLKKPLAGEIITGDDLKPGEIGYLPQQTEVQRDFPASVMEVVLSGCLSRMGNRVFYSREEKQLAVENMKRMGILDRADQCYRELSGGQQQRVLLARALCATQKVLLLDEPVAGLDPKVTADMYRLIQSLNKEGITIIMVSHDVAAALQYAKHILHVGNRVFFGTREEYSSSKLGRLFLEQEGGEA
ncbi:MAG: metal ABC transporter ATP-binding protein [Solobacterium sp.]|nr:metal ABC transporter ATP-binding protein [Solobacterium sp.]MBR3346712.1 metal ABC transporter ATP-binding protein [Solobacterium sp.]